MPTKKTGSKSEKGNQENGKTAKETKSIKAKQAKAFNVAPPPLLPKSLVIKASANAVSASVDVQFFLGFGQLTATLFRNGMMINSQTISHEGAIFFSDTQSGDVISINGVATGVNPDNGNDIPNAAVIAINRPTSPSTPQQFKTGYIIAGYIVL